MLHIYYKTRNEAIEAGVYDNIVAMGNKVCVPLKERKPQHFYPDFDKFNDAQKVSVFNCFIAKKVLG